MAELVDYKTGKPADVPEDQIYQALASGTHAAPPGQKLLLSPDGDLVFSAADTASENVHKYGFKVPTQADLDKFAHQEKYGAGAGNVAKAAALGAGAGPSFGLTTAALTGSGLVSKETARGLEEENPTAYKTGEFGGILASSVLFPESLVGKVAQGAERVGEGAAAVLKAGAKAATKEGSLAAKVLDTGAEIGGKAIGSAVEGSAYGLGQSVSEYSMGDPDLNGEKVLANIGYGALYGGALGGMLKAGELAIPKGVSSARDALGGLYDKYVGKMVDLPGPLEEGATAAQTFEPGSLSKGWAKLSSMASGEPEEAIIQKMVDARNSAIERKSPEEMRRLATEQNKSLQTVYDSMDKASRDVQAARKEEMNALLENHDPAPAVEQIKTVRDQTRQAIAVMKAEPALYPARFARELELLEEHVNSSAFEPKTAEPLYKRETSGATTYSKTPREGAEAVARHTAGEAELPLPSLGAEDIHETLNEVKQKLGAIVPKGMVSDADRRAIELIKGLQSSIKEGLEKGEVWGEAASRQQSLNEAITDHIAAKDNFQREFMKKMKKRGYGYNYVMNPTKTQSWFNMINDPRGEIKTLALKEYLESSRRFTDQIGKTYENAPFSAGKFDKEGFQGLLDKEEKGILSRRNMVASQPGGHGFVTDALHLGMAGGLGGPIAFLGALGQKAFSASANPGGAIEKLVRLETAANRTSAAISRLSKGIFKAADEATKGIPGVGAIGQIFLAPDEERKRFEKRSDEILDRNSDPEAAMNHAVLATEAGFHAAPNMMGSIQQASLRGTSFLAGKIPQPVLPAGPFTKGTKVSIPQINKFNKYYDAVHDPLSVLKGVKEGKFSAEGTEALKTVYPSLYGEISTEIYSALSAHKGKSDSIIPYQKRIALCAFLGTPLDPSLAPENVAANQAVLGALGQKKEAKEAAESANMKFHIAGRYETAQQRANNREAES